MDSFGARTEELLRNTLYALSASRLTLIEAPMFLTRADVRARLVPQLPNSDVRDYWLSRFEPLSEAQKGQFREALLNKVTAFITDPMVRHFLGQQRSTFSFSEAMERGQWVVVNLAKGVLGEHSHTLGNLLFARLQFDIMGRTRIRPEARRTFSVICDEVQNLKENDLVTLLAESRKMGSSIISANQYYDQLPTALRGALLATGTQVFFRLSSQDAGTLSPELSLNDRKRYAAELTALPRGEAIVRVGTDAPVRIRVPRLPGAAPAHEIARIASLSRARYARDRRAIEAEIAARQAPPAAPIIEQQRHEQDSDEGQHEW
jgi:hypothetical protein